MNEQFSNAFSVSEQEKSAQQKRTLSLTPSTVIGWRSWVLFTFIAEEHILHFSDMRGRRFRIKNVGDAEAYICSQLREAITIAELLTRTQLRYPHLVEKTLYRLLNLFIQQALIEEKGISPSHAISIEDMDRYNRQLLFFGLFAQRAEDRFSMQNALTQATVVVLGLGGVGNWVARHLAAMGVGRLILVDYDTVERSNLNRQALYTPMDLGKQKVEVAANVLKAFNPRLEVQILSLKIASPEDIERVIEGATIAVLTADKPMIEIRRWMTIACVRQQIPYIQGSLDAYLLQIGPLYHVPDTGCYICRETSMQHAEGPSYTARIEAYKNSPREKPPLLGPLCGFVGSAVALETVRYISKYQPPSALGRYYSIDARTWAMQIVTVPKNEKCPVCSTSSASAPDALSHTLVQDNEESLKAHG